MNRDALRASAHNGCVEPVRGRYGAVSLSGRGRPRATVRPRRIALVLALAGLTVLVYFLVSSVLEPRPSLRILSPAADSVISSGKVTVAVEVENAELSSSTTSSKGRHLHYYLDAVVPTDRAKPAVPASGAWTSTTKTSHEWAVTGAGLHILAVQLVAGDDRPLSPAVVAAVVVQVPRPAAPPPAASPQPTSPVK